MSIFQQLKSGSIFQKTGLGAIMLFFVVFSSCSDGQVGISNLKVGERNSGEATLGLPMQINADVKLEENIVGIVLDIVSLDIESDEWTYQQDFGTKYSGTNTAKFDEQYMFPNGTLAGDYELTLTVTGESGAIVQQKRDFKILVDSTVPFVDELEVGINASGDDLHLAAHIAAARKIRQVVLLVEGSEWSKEFVFEQARIKDQTSVHFHEHAHVDEAPAGTYQVTLTVEDQDGRQASATADFNKK